MYVEPNKERTHNWLSVNRLKLPLPSTRFGFFNNSISQNSKNVNTKNDESSNDIKYSIGYTTDNNPVVVINDDILKGVKKSDWVKTVKNTISDKFSNGIPIKGRFIKVNRITRNEYTNSKYSKNKKNYDTVIYKDKFKTANNLDEIIIASTNYVNEDLKHTRKDSFKKFARGDVLIRVGSNDYSAKVIVGFTKGNEMVLYDIINFVPEKLDIKKIDTQYRPTTENVESDRTSVSITNSISENRNNVNTKNDESSNDIKYSMGGLKAETADKSALEKAMELEKDGTDSEKIRKETGWFKGYDGKWRFEIDNSELKFKTDIEKNRAAAIELAKMKVKSAELEEKIVNNTATKAEENEYYNLDEKMIEYRKGVKLSDVINHPKLFEAYPQLKNVDVYYEISSVNRGVYSSNGNVIMLNPMHTIDEQKEAIIHEIQHAIQGIENFANGSNLEYWKNLGYSDEEAMAMYYNTAGEREARDVSARRDYNAEQRKNIRPDIDRKDVVFANSGDVGYSADENIMQNDFEKKVDQIENNTYNSDDVVIMGRTPKVLQDIGFNSLPVAMTKKHIYSVAVSEARAKNEGRYKQNTNYHDLGFNTVKQIYNKISDPLMVIAHPDFTNKESRDSTHKVIALVDLSVNNKQVIAPIVVDFESRYNKKIIDVNLVATYFNKNNIHDLIKEAIALENNNQVGFYYLDKKRTQSIIKQKGYQLPSVLNNLSSNIIIRKIDSNVNKKINKITQSKQFVRWFGDWQNSPKSASKVVDGNGEPLVVYHQTGNDFNVFDANKKGAGEFDSEMPTGIFMKPTSDNIGVSGNKQMALYANIRNPLTVNNRAELVRFYEQNIDGYKEARDYISSIDSEYKQKYEQAEAEEDAEYSKLWTAREQGKITEDEYQKAIESNALDELEEEWHNKVNEASKEAKSLIDDYFRTSNYDGVIVNNDAGSFGRTTKTYIAFSNTQVKSATDNIGTFDGRNSDIRYAVDDTINDWLDDESTPQGIDYEKAVEKNPVIAVAKIYKSAAQTAKSGLAQGKNVKLDEKEYLRIAGSIMQTYGIKGKYNPNYKKELASQLKNFVDSIGKKDANFTDLFEELVNDCKGGILLSGEYDTTLMREEREFVLDMLQGKVLLIKPRDVQQIEEDYGSVANYRVALELNPTEKGGKNLNVIKVASAYGKDVDLQGFINKSKILYVEPNKERTHNWLSVNRLKLPLPSTRYGFFNNSISQSENNVNTKNNTDKGVESGDVKYSIKENVKNKVSGEIYDKVVVLDTNIFKGIPPRNWGKTFRNFISKHLIGKKFLTFDENGKEEIIEFAKPNERVTKNGANNSHKVIDKLSRKSDRNSKLVIVHSDEVINISEKQHENAEHSHQWLDENGWEFRNAFVMDKYGKIYSVTLNIAKSKDGRNILYDINKINEVGYGDVLSNAKGKRSSHINPNFVTNSISQNSKNVNTKNDESGNDIKYSMGGLKAETADKSALEKAMELEKDGTDSEKIRKETGWFKGYDGKWRFEIDNSELKFKTDIEKNRAAAIELAKMKVKSAELEEKIVNNTATKAEENEYYNLDEKMIEYRKGVKLSDVINHPKLFEAYPQLKNVDVYYEISSVNRGVYSSNGNVIMLNPMHTIDEQKEAIIHEIQHAIQGIENFANGSNLEYWKNLGYSDEEAMAMYYNTAGEREARDVSARRDYNAEQRKNIRPDIDRKDVVFANSGDVGYSADENIMQNDFEKKVDQIENNTYNSDDVVIMGRTPKVLQDIGFNSLPVAMTKKHIYSVAVSEARAKNEGRYKQNTNYHDLGFNTVKQIYNKISDPLMVIAHPDFTNKESRDSTHKVIALVDLSVNNKQVIAPIVVDFESRYNKKIIDVNLVATYFNKNNINDLIKEAIALENNNQVGFYYLDKKRTQSIIKHEGYQLPSILNNSSSNIIIRKIDSNVNKKIKKITQSQQFVRWFGDWQNKPKTASKVVDGNGEPLVVYHQTGNDFTVFDTKHTGAGEFDSEMPTGIFMKPTNSNIGLSGNFR